MKQFLVDLSGQRRYWAALVLIGIVLEAAALYYQYALDEWPCVLCIHVRIWVMAFVLLGTVAFFCTRSKFAIRTAHGLSVLIMAGLLERSWRVLAVERGWIFGGSWHAGMVCAGQMDSVPVRSANFLWLHAFTILRYNHGRVPGRNFSADVDNERGSFHCQLVRLVLLEKAAFDSTFTTIMNHSCKNHERIFKLDTLRIPVNRPLHAKAIYLAKYMAILYLWRGWD